MRFFRMAGIAALASLVVTGSAVAQEDGVFIDPDSPSAKEYRIPLEAERRQADPGQEPSAGIVQGERSSPIFGTGIVSGAESQRAKGTSGPRSKDGGAANASRSGEPPAADGDAAEILKAATSNPGPPGGGIGMPLTIGGVAIGVLLLGGLAGVLLRRRA